MSASSEIIRGFIVDRYDDGTIWVRSAMNSRGELHDIPIPAPSAATAAEAILKDWIAILAAVKIEAAPGNMTCPYCTVELIDGLGPLELDHAPECVVLRAKKQVTEAASAS